MKDLGKKIVAVTLVFAFVFTTACGKGNKTAVGDTEITDTKTTDTEITDTGTELKIYTLYDSTSLRQAIKLYKTNHKEVEVSLEIGLTGDDGVTVNDALINLNTTIMAGKGPDIIILDGLPVDSYIEKGLLLDISDVLTEINETDGIFKNIANIYQKDGKNYAIPTRFIVPLILGKEETLAAIDGLDTLAEVLCTGHEGEPETALANATLFFDCSAMLESIYPSSSITWVKEDGTLDEAKVKSFIEQSKNIYDTQLQLDISYNEFPDGGVGRINTFAYAYEDEWDNSSFDLLNLFKMDNGICIYNVTSIVDFSSALGWVNYFENGAYDFMQEQSETVFIPTTTVGISVKSEKVDLAKTFLKELLSIENQTSALLQGLPVNRKAFDEIYSGLVNNEDAYIFISWDGVNIKLPWPTEEEIVEFKNKIEAITESSVINVTIKDTVLEEAHKCLADEISVEEAAGNIISKINIYLAE